MYKLIKQETKEYITPSGENAIKITSFYEDEETGAKKTTITTKIRERIGNPDLGQCLFTEEDRVKGMARRTIGKALVEGLLEKNPSNKSLLLANRILKEE